MKMITKDLTTIVFMKAFTGEPMARNKYEYFAKIAQKEGYRDMAKYFLRAGNNEKIHVKLYKILMMTEILEILLII